MWSLHQVNFSSLDIHLHTEALLNSMNFLNNLLPPMKKEAQEEQPILPKEEEEEEEEAKIEDSAVTKKSSKKVRCLFFMVLLFCLDIILISYFWLFLQPIRSQSLRMW